MSYPMTNPPFPQSRSGNGDGPAIAGFILSLLGFTGCLLLCPVGAIVSYFGLSSERNRGLAIAGIVLGIVGTIPFLIVAGILVMMLLSVLFAAGAAGTLVAPIAKTHEAFARGHVLLAQQHELPVDGPAGDKILADADLVDGWGQPIFYVTENDGDYHLVSAGMDQRLNTKDDMESYPNQRATFNESQQRLEDADTLPAESLPTEESSFEPHDVETPTAEAESVTPSETEVQP